VSGRSVIFVNAEPMGAYSVLLPGKDRFFRISFSKRHAKSELTAEENALLSSFTLL
jgi:hypothetical protein